MNRETLNAYQNRIDDSSKRIDNAYASACKRAGVASADMDILYVLHIYGQGRTQAELCSLSYANKQTVNSAIHKMEREGLVRLESTGGRGKGIFLTKEGQDRAEKVISPIREAELETCSQMGEEHLVDLVELLERHAELLCYRLDGIWRE